MIELAISIDDVLRPRRGVEALFSIEELAKVRELVDPSLWVRHPGTWRYLPVRVNVLEVRQVSWTADSLVLPLPPKVRKLGPGLYDLDKWPALRSYVDPREILFKPNDVGEWRFATELDS